MRPRSRRCSGKLVGSVLWLTWAFLVRIEKIVPPPCNFTGENLTALRKVLWALVMAVGTAMGTTSAILVLTPVLMPVVNAAGIDPVNCGVMFIMVIFPQLVTRPASPSPRRTADFSISADYGISR